MSQLNLPLSPENEFLDAVSPLREMGAYEYLWLNYPGNKSPSTKSIVDLFASRPGAIPTDFVSSEKAAECANNVYAQILRSGFKDLGIRIRGVSDYPTWLESANHQLPIIYFKGLWDLIWKPRRISIVGTRRPSELGRKRTISLCKKLIEHDYTIVSGLARGIDTVAHETALSMGAPTMAVLGTPITESYPKENASLQAEISNKGIVVSHVPFLFYAQRDWRWNRMFFPDRNVTMSALSDATVIVEAGETSGTLIQARAALKQGRKVFILASNFHNPSVTWPAKYLAKGAIKVDSVDDILGALDGQASQV